MTRISALKLMVALFAFCVTTMPASSLSAEQLTINYAAQKYNGPPKFRVQAYREGSSRPIWNSKIISAEGGLTTAELGSDRNGNLNWQQISFQLEPSIKVDYFRIIFLNDASAGYPTGGDRNFFVKWIKYQGNRFQASNGKKSAN